jgi:hypothetical protein
MAESYVVFEMSDPSKPAGALKGQEATPSFTLPHIIQGGKSCADVINVVRVLKDGSLDTRPVRFVGSLQEAQAEANKGYFVLHMASTC